jgi:hypothetical protein
LKIKHHKIPQEVPHLELESRVALQRQEKCHTKASLVTLFPREIGGSNSIWSLELARVLNI